MWLPAYRYEIGITHVTDWTATFAAYAVIILPIALIIFVTLVDMPLSPLEAHCDKIGGKIIPVQYVSGVGTVYECEVS